MIGAIVRLSAIGGIITTTEGDAFFRKCDLRPPLVFDQSLIGRVVTFDVEATDFKVSWWPLSKQPGWRAIDIRVQE